MRLSDRRRWRVSSSQGQGGGRHSNHHHPDRWALIPPRRSVRHQLPLRTPLVQRWCMTAPRRRWPPPRRMAIAVCRGPPSLDGHGHGIAHADEGAGPPGTLAGRRVSPTPLCHATTPGVTRCPRCWCMTAPRRRSPPAACGHRGVQHSAVYSLDSREVAGGPADGVFSLPCHSTAATAALLCAVRVWAYKEVGTGRGSVV